MSVRGGFWGLLALCLCACSSEPISEASQPDRNPPPWEAWAHTNPAWIAPVQPFTIIDNIHFVGTQGISSFLITSDGGHFLLDGGLPQNAPMIAQNIKALGYDISDVKILLNSHAHFDHSGGLAALKTMSGAKLYASQGDLSALEGGFYLGAEDKPQYSAPPVKVDTVIAEGDVLRLGETSLTARMTPGHTRGCTSWTMNAHQGGEQYEVLFFCSISVAGNRLIPPQYEGIVQDYQNSFEAMRSWQPDIFLGNHTGFFRLKDKRAKQLKGETQAFVNPKEFSNYLRKSEAKFNVSLARASAAHE